MNSPYPETSYLIRGETPRLRILDEQGRPDPAAIARSNSLLPIIDVPEDVRGRAGIALARMSIALMPIVVAKGMLDPAGLQSAGVLVDHQGIPIVIEYPMGVERSGVGKDGVRWTTTMQAAYGFIPSTVSADLEEVDVYLGPSTTAPQAVVIHQVKEDGSHDELKVLLGFDDLGAALRCYLAHVPAWCFGGASLVPVELLSGMLGTMPASLGHTYKGAQLTPEIVARIWTSELGSRTQENLDAPPPAEAGVAESAKAEPPIDAPAQATAPTEAPPAAEPPTEGSAANPDTHTFTVVTRGDGALGVGRVLRALKRLGDIGTSSALYIPIEGGGTLSLKALSKVTDFDGDGSSKIERIELDGAEMVASKDDLEGLPPAVPADPTTEPSPAAEAPPPPTTEEKAADHTITVAGDTFVEVAPFDACMEKLRALGHGEDQAKAFADSLMADSQKAAQWKRHMKALDIVKGWWASTSHLGQAIPLVDCEDQALAEAVRTSPITEAYPSPDDVGGWLGVMEPPDGRWIGFVAADGRTLIWDQRDENGGVMGMPFYLYRLDLATMPISEAIAKGFRPIAKFGVRAVHHENAPTHIAKSGSALIVPGKRLVYGVVLEPDPCDGQGDSQGHTYTADDIEEACHYYSHFRMLNAEHKGPPIDPADARVVQTFIAPTDFMLGTQLVKKGSWVMVAQIRSDALWAKIESGAWQAWSVEGYSRTIPLDSAHLNSRQMNCTRCSASWRASVPKEQFFPHAIECPKCHVMTPTATN